MAVAWAAGLNTARQARQRSRTAFAPRIGVTRISTPLRPSAYAKVRNCYSTLDWPARFEGRAVNCCRGGCAVRIELFVLLTVASAGGVRSGGEGALVRAAGERLRGWLR